MLVHTIHNQELHRELPSALLAERLSGLRHLRGNRLPLLVDGEETFESILSGIDRARDCVLFQFFIVKADEIGSHGLPREYVRELREAWVGGHNVGDEYLGRDPAFPVWRDTHLHVVGPAAL